MSNSPESRTHFLENTKHLHSFGEISIHDRKLGQDPDTTVSRVLGDLQTKSGLEIHVVIDAKGNMLLGHPEQADLDTGDLLTSDAMTPADLLRAVQESENLTHVTLDHRPWITRPRLATEVMYISALARQLMHRAGATISINSPERAFLDNITTQEGANNFTLQQQVTVPVWRGLIPGVAMRALEKTRENGGISEHASQVRIGDGFPIEKIGIAEVADFVANNGFKDGIPRTLHATGFPTVKRNGKPFKTGEIIEGHQLGNVYRVANDTNGAVSGVTLFARNK